MPIGWFLAALSALAPLPAAAAPAATPDPALRRSEQLDLRRVGKVSEDERSVLRVEWRAGLSGVEETQRVQEMLDSLRRMEGTVAEIGRLIRSIQVQKPATAPAPGPAQKPVAAPVAAEPSDADDGDSRLLLANLAAGTLVALWWFRRRKSGKYPEAAPGTATEEAPPIAAPLTVTLATAPPVESLPASAPIAAVPAVAPSIAAQQPAPVEPAAEPRREAARIEPHIESKAFEVVPAPTPVAAPAVEPAAPPKLEEVKPAAPQPAEVPVIDFSLEEADPESVAREEAKARRPRKNVYPAVPESTPETNVEPTLQLAEIMLSMGLEQGAAQALLEYTEANPRQAVYHWLKLLGIYRKRGQQAEFVETAEKLRKHFNVQAEDWIRADTGEAPTLEKFPRVAEQVQKTWLQPAECMSYLRNLLEDNRDGARAGFPQAVAEEILLLIEVLKETSGTGQAVGL
ncbi:MAG: fimV2 [Rhodocyclaceae bacterium]|nr:MAG: fimV2 [Rhodocyclaceae bacterium]TND04893.1 MAG: fimV2 [Rhodocyclaceae bacterium]